MQQHWKDSDVASMLHRESSTLPLKPLFCVGVIEDQIFYTWRKDPPPPPPPFADPHHLGVEG